MPNPEPVDSVACRTVKDEVLNGIALGRFRGQSRRFAVLVSAALLAIPATQAGAQSTKVGNTLRYGSGLLDVPVASVQPHLSLVVAYSGFSVAVDEPPLIDAAGDIVGFATEPFDEWLSDAAVTLGLLDRAEIGVSFQSSADGTGSGRIIGMHGRLSLVQPQAHGLGVALGARWTTSPSFDDSGRDDYRPSRLGHADARLFEAYADPDRADVNTAFSPYVVATLMLKGLESGLLPLYDVTFVAGWGAGHFRDGADLAWYQSTDTGGFFAGSVFHLVLADNRLLNFLAEWNGFDLNLGLEADLGGFRVGGFLLGANYREELSVYRSRKWGIKGSVALCPRAVNLCRPELLNRAPADTVFLPAPPPDTVVVEREVMTPLPSGEATELCLSTGEAVTVWITAAGDTLVGSRRIPVRDLESGLEFAGEYAAGQAWYENDEVIELSGERFAKTGAASTRACGAIRRVGEYRGVPLFADRVGDAPIRLVLVPVGPGVWWEYGRVSPDGESGRAPRGGPLASLRLGPGQILLDDPIGRVQDRHGSGAGRLLRFVGVGAD